MIFLHTLTFPVGVRRVCLHVACMIPSLITLNTAGKFVTWDIGDGWITIMSLVKMI